MSESRKSLGVIHVLTTMAKFDLPFFSDEDWDKIVGPLHYEHGFIDTGGLFIPRSAVVAIVKVKNESGDVRNDLGSREKQ